MVIDYEVFIKTIVISRNTWCMNWYGGYGLLNLKRRFGRLLGNYMM